VERPSRRGRPDFQLLVSRVQRMTRVWARKDIWVPHPCDVLVPVARVGWPQLRHPKQDIKPACSPDQNRRSLRHRSPCHRSQPIQRIPSHPMDTRPGFGKTSVVRVSEPATALKPTAAECPLNRGKTASWTSRRCRACSANLRDHRAHPRAAPSARVSSTRSSASSQDGIRTPNVSASRSHDRTEFTGRLAGTG